jgi:hypothetical protein
MPDEERIRRRAQGVAFFQLPGRDGPGVRFEQPHQSFALARQHPPSATAAATAASASRPILLGAMEVGDPAELLAGGQHLPVAPEDGAPYRRPVRQPLPPRFYERA